MRLLKPSLLILVVALSPVVGLFAGCNSDQEAATPLAKVTTPPPKTAQESGKSKAPDKAKGISRSPDTLPGPPK
jgi:hypothetical protein